MAHLRAFVPALTAAMLLPASASAFEYFTIGAGFMGQAGGNFTDKPGDQTIYDPATGQAVDIDGIPDYPGFAGLTMGFGFFVDFRAFDYVGLEFDVLRQWDKGQADMKITINTTEYNFDVEVRQGAWHLPLLLKGVIPGELVQPSIFIGPEFVVVDNSGDPEGAESEIISGDDPPGVEWAAYSENYTNLMFGLGVEFKLPIPEVDIRIPFSLRGAVNLGISDERKDRERDHFVDDGGSRTINKIEYKTNFKYQAIGNLGVGIHF